MALQDGLLASPLYREFTLALRKTASDMLPKLLAAVRPFVEDEHLEKVNSISRQLEELLESVPENKQPLKSKHDVRNQTMRTTVVAQKVELSIHKASVSEEEAKYSVIVDEFVELVNSFLSENILSVKDVLFSEIIFYDDTHADSAVFLPKARPALERALASPQDYLGCDCCKRTEEVQYSMLTDKVY
jgi:origin recognition complex subunit 3